MTDPDRLPQLHVDAGIARVTLNDPATFNSLSPDAFGRLSAIIADIQERAFEDVNAVLITGTGKAFCAGAELSSMFQLGREPEESQGQRIARWTAEEGTPVIKAWSDLPIPSVAAVNGVAAGLGVALALCTDVVVAARSASFKLPFLTGLGILPDGGLTWLLPRLIGSARTNAMALLGERIDAEQAERWGMIWQCVDDAELETRGLDLARRMAQLPEYAATEMRAAMSLSLRQDYPAQYDYELARNVELLDRPEFDEGISAFFEKRAPQFRR